MDAPRMISPWDAYLTKQSPKMEASQVLTEYMTDSLEAVNGLSFPPLMTGEPTYTTTLGLTRVSNRIQGFQEVWSLSRVLEAIAKKGHHAGIASDVKNEIKRRTRVMFKKVESALLSAQAATTGTTAVPARLGGFFSKCTTNVQYLGAALASVSGTNTVTNGSAVITNSSTNFNVLTAGDVIEITVTGLPKEYKTILTVDSTSQITCNSNVLMATSAAATMKYATLNSSGGQTGVKAISETSDGTSTTTGNSLQTMLTNMFNSGCGPRIWAQLSPALQQRWSQTFTGKPNSTVNIDQRSHKIDAFVDTYISTVSGIIVDFVPNRTMGVVGDAYANGQEVALIDREQIGIAELIPFEVMQRDPNSFRDLSGWMEWWLTLYYGVEAAHGGWYTGATPTA